MALPIDEFERFLTFDDLVLRYRKELEQESRRTKREFWAQAEFKRNQKAEGIELEKQHRLLLNLCVFPFTRGQPGASLGYEFARGSPLREVSLPGTQGEPPNFDFLVANIRDKPAVCILGEAKGAIQDPASAIRETIQKREFAAGQADYIAEQYLRLPKDLPMRLEFVVACPSTEATEVLFEAERAEPPLIVWHAPLAGLPILKVATPPEGGDRHRMLHGDDRLNDLLKGIRSSPTCFDLWPKMHPALLLGAVYREVEQDDKNIYVDAGLVKDVVEKDIFYLSQAEQKRVVEDILKLTVDIGLITPVAGTGRFRVATARERRRTTEIRAHRLWIEARLRRDLDEAYEQVRTKVQERFRRERATRSTLEDSW